MLLNEVSPPNLNPVPIRELAAQLRLAQGFSDDGSEDALLELYLRNATAVIERSINGALITRQFTYRTARWNRNGHLHLPIGPVGAIDTFQIIQSGTTVDLTEDEWVMDPGSRRQRVTGPGCRALPTLSGGAVAELTFSAGYGPSWNELPDDLRHAVLMLAAHFYENRDGEIEADDGLPFGLSAILERHSAIRL
ncbi:MAG: head-tail connector protein [Pseudomonadota bacterium]